MYLWPSRSAQHNDESLKNKQSPLSSAEIASHSTIQADTVQKNIQVAAVK